METLLQRMQRSASVVKVHGLGSLHQIWYFFKYQILLELFTFVVGAFGVQVSAAFGPLLSVPFGFRLLTFGVSLRSQIWT